MQKDLTKGSALKNIITFSLPFLLANFLQTFYGMADLFIVGQYNGAASLSGVSIGSHAYDYCYACRNCNGFNGHDWSLCW